MHNLEDVDPIMNLKRKSVKQIRSTVKSDFRVRGEKELEESKILITWKLLRV